MGKRGQVTIFLIVGVIILFVSAAVFFLVSQFQKERLGVEKEEVPSAAYLRAQVRSFVESCLEETAAPAIYLLGYQGGRLYPEDGDFLLTEEQIVSYGYLNGEKKASREKAAKDLGRFIEGEIDQCLGDFSTFREQGMEIKRGEKKALVVINDNKVNLNLEYPLKVKKGSDEVELKDFISIVSVRLGHLMDIQEQIVGAHEKEPFNYNLANLTDGSETVVIFPFDEETSLFSVYDEKSVLQGLPYYYFFAIRDAKSNLPPLLEYIPDFVLTEGKEFVYLLEASDPEMNRLTFSSDSPDFPISEEGQLSFIPGKTGVFYVTFAVEDTKKAKDTQKVRLVVEEG